MKIESVKISPEEAQLRGLRPATLSRLGQVVLIAGKNGAGKTRFLQSLDAQIKAMLQIGSSREVVEQQLAQTEEGLAQHQQALAHQQAQLAVSANKLALQGQVRNYERGIVNLTQDITNLHGQIALLDSIQVSGNGNTFFYVPKALKLDDCNSLTKTALLENAARVTSSGVDNLPAGTLPAIQVIQNRYFEVTHQQTIVEGQEKERAVADYNRLTSFITTFLGVELGRNSDGDATLFGRRLGQVGLSDGQKVLLQFCVALHAQEVSLHNLVLLLDEPENHLHPAALNEVIDKLRAVVTDGQLWIATHSIHVLAHFDDPTIYYMEDGELTYAGDVPERVLQGLLGSEDEREKLAAFLALPFEFSSTRFAYESLLDAPVTMTGTGDPQVAQIKTALIGMQPANASIKVLDYGAGKGRLIATIQEADADKKPVAEWLNYVAYDLFSTYADECRKNIGQVYGAASDRYYNELIKLREQHGEGTFDVVILTNVFHEIPPNKWPEVLGAGGIQQLLKPEGTLLIVEDQRLPHGENAHEYGFLVLDKLEFAKLFDISEEEKADATYSCHDAREDGRLRAHYFKRPLLNRVTTTTRAAAIQELNRNAKTQIEKVRREQHSFKNGKTHAFWLHQFANSQLALTDLG